MRSRGAHCPHSETEKCFNKRKSLTVSTIEERSSITYVLGAGEKDQKKIGHFRIQNDFNRAMTTEAILQDVKKK